MDSWTLESFSSGASILRSSPAREGLHACFPRCDCLGVRNTGDHALQIPTTSRVADLVDSGIKIVSTLRSVVEHVEIILILNIMKYFETKFILLNRCCALLWIYIVHFLNLCHSLSLYVAVNTNAMRSRQYHCLVNLACCLMTLNRHRQAKTLLEQAGFPRFQGFWMILVFFGNFGFLGSCYTTVISCYILPKTWGPSQG